MRRLLTWIDQRTGYKHFLNEALYESIPGGSRWRYVWGSTLVFTFTLQLITGIFLWMAYSPSTQTAWESVYYIQHEMQFGWLLRGLHHFTAQAMIVLLVLHLMQVVIDGAYRAPREVNFWLGLILMLIVLGLSLTGYLLPWDQKGYWATRVATGLLGIVPVFGEQLERLALGGSDYGHHTLTRFFALHAGVLPALMIVFLVLHVAVFRRHKITAKLPYKKADEYFWPDQILKDAVACLAVLAVICFFIVRHGITGDHTGQAPGDYLGAELGAPADPANEYAAARPEWYFLFLFQFLKLFTGYGHTGELLGAIVVPGIILLILFLMPILGRWQLGHRFNLLFVGCLLLGVAMLTAQALRDDYVALWYDEPQFAANEEKLKEYFEGDEAQIKNYRHSKEFLTAVAAAQHDAERAKELARSSLRIPPQGAGWLLRNDPAKLFEKQCASCHSHIDPQGQGIKGPPIAADAEGPQSAPNLYRFASRDWIRGLLDPERIAGPEYFGNTAHADGEMVNFVQGDDWRSLDPEKKEDIVIALSAQAGLESQRELDEQDKVRIARGIELLKSEDLCAMCHTFQDIEVGAAPDLTGYGSRSWTGHFIANAAAERFYGENNDRMPIFNKDPHVPEENVLSLEQISLINQWLRGELP